MQIKTLFQLISTNGHEGWPRGMATNGLVVNLTNNTFVAIPRGLNMMLNSQSKVDSAFHPSEVEVKNA